MDRDRLFDSLPKDVLRLILARLDRGDLLRLRLAWCSALVDDIVFGQMQPPYVLSATERARALHTLHSGGKSSASSSSASADTNKNGFVLRGSESKRAALSWMALSSHVRHTTSVTCIATPDLARTRGSLTRNLFETVHLLDDSTMLACGYTVARGAFRGQSVVQRVPLASSTADSVPVNYASASLLLDGGNRVLIGTSKVAASEFHKHLRLFLSLSLSLSHSLTRIMLLILFVAVDV